MESKLYSNITCPQYWRRSSLIRNVFNIKHHTPSKLMYSNYQIMKILENCFQNMNYFSWIQLISFISNSKHCCSNIPSLELLRGSFRRAVPFIEQPANKKKSIIKLQKKKIKWSFRNGFFFVIERVRPRDFKWYVRKNKKILDFVNKKRFCHNCYVLLNKR